MATDVEVPALGESITEGTLAQWLKKPGEAVAADEPIASLETDKVSVEVPSPVAGVLTEQLAQEGDNVAVGAVIARIDEKATAGAAVGRAPASARPGRRGCDDQPRRSRRESCAARRFDTRRSAEAGPRGRPDHHAVAGRAPRGARISCRPDQDPRQRQGRAPDQGRRDRGGSGAEAFPGAGRGPGAAGESSCASERQGSPPVPRPSPHRRAPRRARQDVAPSPDHREAPQGSAEHRRAC